MGEISFKNHVSRWVVAQAFTLSTQEAEGGGSLGVRGLQSEYPHRQGYMKKPWTSRTYAVSLSSAFIAPPEQACGSAQLSDSCLQIRRKRKASVSSYIGCGVSCLFVNHWWLTLIPIPNAEGNKGRKPSASSLCINKTLLPVLGGLFGSTILIILVS